MSGKIKFMVAFIKSSFVRIEQQQKRVEPAGKLRKASNGEKE